MEACLQMPFSIVPTAEEFARLSVKAQQRADEVAADIAKCPSTQRALDAFAMTFRKSKAEKLRRWQESMEAQSESPEEELISAVPSLASCSAAAATTLDVTQASFHGARAAGSAALPASQLAKEPKENCGAGSRPTLHPNSQVRASSQATELLPGHRITFFLVFFLNVDWMCALKADSREVEQA